MLATLEPRSPKVLEILPWLVPGLAFVLWYDIAAYRMAGTLGFPLDDAWIHAQFARNLATFHGFTYTAGQWVPGSTSPAWTLVLAAGFLVARNVVVAATILGISLQLATGVLAARLVAFLTGYRELALAAGLIVSVLPALVWGAVSGMEVTLVSALVLWGFLRYLTSDRTGQQLRAIALFVLAALARPENLVLLGVVSLHFVARSRGLGAALQRTAGVALIVAAMLGPFVLFDYATTGRPLPTTFYAKSGPGLVHALSTGDHERLGILFSKWGPDAVWKFGETLFDQIGWAAPIALAGFAAAFVNGPRRRGAALIACSIVVAAFSMGLIAPQRLKPSNYRYVVQFVALSSVLAVSAFGLLWPLISNRLVRLALLAACGALVADRTVRGADVFAQSVSNIEQLQVRLGEWFRQNAPPGTRVAANDIGALAYFSRLEIIDLEGLVSPAALLHPRATRGIGFATETHPDYIAIFPSWYPDIAGRPDLFKEIHRVSISNNVISAGDALLVYATPWVRQPSLGGALPGK